MRRQLVTGLVMTVALTLLLGVAFPLVVTAIGQVAFHDKANGSFVKAKGHDVGSSLLGQTFNTPDGKPDPRYLQPRPSAISSTPYDAMNSGASNLGPSSPALLDQVAKRVKEYRAFNGLSSTEKVPVDAVTASGSGLDPGISVANARLQAPRIAKARGLSEAAVLAVIDRHTDKRQLGFLGETSVNVLAVNLDLDKG